jgi:hypothetical protein
MMGRFRVRKIAVQYILFKRSPEATGEVVYTLRVRGDAFRPKVFAPGKYTIHVGELGTARSKSLRAAEAVAESSNTKFNDEP